MQRQECALLALGLVVLAILTAAAATDCPSLTECTTCAAASDCVWCLGVDCKPSCVESSKKAACRSAINSTASCGAAITCASHARNIFVLQIPIRTRTRTRLVYNQITLSLTHSLTHSLTRTSFLHYKKGNVAALQPLVNPDLELGYEGWEVVGPDFELISDKATPHLGKLAMGFGPLDESAVPTLQQSFTLPAGTNITHLSFYVLVHPDASQTIGVDTLFVLIDEVPLVSRDIDDKTAGYIPVEIDIKDYANDKPHTLAVRSYLFGSPALLSSEIDVDTFRFIESTRTGNLNDGVVSGRCALGCAAAGTAKCDPACNNPMCGLEPACNITSAVVHMCYDNFKPVARQSMSFCSTYSKETCCRYSAHESAAHLTYNALPKECTESTECATYLEELACAVCSPHSALFFSGGKLVVCNNYARKIWSVCKGACSGNKTTVESWLTDYVGLGVTAFGSINCFQGSDCASVLIICCPSLLHCLTHGLVIPPQSITKTRTHLKIGLSM